MKKEERKKQLLKLAAEYIDKYCDDQPIFYDAAECDGASLVRDIELELTNK